MKVESLYDPVTTEYILTLQIHLQELPKSFPWAGVTVVERDRHLTENKDLRLWVQSASAHARNNSTLDCNKIN